MFDQVKASRSWTLHVFVVTSRSCFAWSPPMSSRGRAELRAIAHSATAAAPRTTLEAPTGTAPPSARTTMSGSSSSSIVEKHDVELAYLLGFADQVDLDDLAVGDREADHRPAQPARGPDERWDSVHDGPLRAAGSPGADGCDR